MKQRGSGEATRKVPVGVELRKTAIGSDAQFARASYNRFGRAA